MNIAVLGCGNMGRAIITGLCQKNSKKTVITAWDKSKKARDACADIAKITRPETWLTRDKVPDVIIIAVKPQDIKTSLRVFAANHSSPSVKHILWLSIAAGVSIDTLMNSIDRSCRICRVMPNTPALIGKSASAYSLNTHCRKKDVVLVEKILNTFGNAVSVPESMINAITGLSGSGPAYVYLFIEALIEGGITAGLPRAVAETCAIQTVLGAAQMIESTGKSPAELKAQVMSPGGTTVKGLCELEKYGFRYSVIQAIVSASQRAEELGKE